ncbi:MAG TPA: SgcJ/EcaC family oxidoreductase [Candidatus Udaeobacter sp.]|jgi:uncharacterized protein (TIGR02246 family)|nr:SgcJ/EcaC family oxidoreductase [Candidatus Udaeobacter sp.]
MVTGFRIGLQLAIAAVLCLAGAAHARDSASDADRIRQLEKDFMSRWTAGDAAGCASLFADDGVRVGARGDVQHGRAEIEQAYTRLFGGVFKGASVTGGPAVVRPLGESYALCEAPFTITTAAGSPLQGFSIEVLRKVRGRWWILESHPKLYPAASP